MTKNKKGKKEENTKKIKQTKALNNQKTPKIKMEKNNKNPNEIKKLGVLLIYILLIVVIFYLITMFFVDGSDDFFSGFGSKDDKSTQTKVDEEMDYSIIPASSTFKVSSSEYYVLFYDMSDKDNENLTSVATSTSKEVYKVDLSKAINKNIIATDTNSNANSLSELRVKDPTLIKISNGKNVLYLESFIEIIKEL